MQTRILCLTPIQDIFGVTRSLRDLGDLTIKPDETSETLERYLEENKTDVLFVNPNRQQFFLGSKLLNLSGAKVIATASTGTDHIDMRYCAAMDIKVLCLKDQHIIYQIPSTAEHALALTLSLIRQIPKAMSSVQTGNWDCEQFVGEQISDLTVGVVGQGRLGTKYAKYCDAMGANILVSDPFVSVPLYPNLSLKELLPQADILSLHVHLTDKTRHLINEKALKLMKTRAVIINTSRGGIIDEEAVCSALRAETLGGYATDVLQDEHNHEVQSPVIQAMSEGENVIVTPHIGGMTRGAREMAYNHAVTMLKKHLTTNEIRISTQ